MNSLIEVILVLVVLSNLLILGTTRLKSEIRIMSLQGTLLALLPIFAHEGGGEDGRFFAIVFGTIFIKGLIFPMLFNQVVDMVHVDRESHPFVSPHASMILGIVALGASFWLNSKLILPRPTISQLVLPVAFFTFFSGLFLIVSRKKAISQVLGYLVMENGIYAFGVALALEIPFLVELGVLMDIVIAAFVMGILIFHIQKTFKHIDTDRLDPSPEKI